METVFVTGGTGLVGTHLLYDLLQKGQQVRALKRPQSNTSQVLQTFGLYTDDAETLFRQIEWVDADLLDFNSMSDAMDGCSQVYHAAAVVSFCRADKERMLRININGTSNIVNVCLEKQAALCFVSSIGALGRSTPGEPITENDLWQTSKGRSDYAYSKHKSEMEIWRGIAEGLKATIVNPAVIFGPGDWTKGSASFFSQVHKGMRFHTPGVTAFVDVRDVCRCMVQLMEEERYGERFILSAGDMSYREIFEAIADGLQVKKPSIAAQPWMINSASSMAWLASMVTGKSPALTKETAQSAFQQHRYANEKVMKTLEYEFIPLKTTIEDCCQYFLQHKCLST